MQGRLCRNFGRKSRSLVSGPDIGVMSGIPKVPPRMLDSLQAPLSESQVSLGVGYPALRQTPYVALVVLAYGEILLSGVETDPICGVGCTGVWGDM
ncbi:organic cation/carnitine transporter 3 [Prunus dulcis]|uniref:Organic cation/carnitine transporter 3 n=1 Tax=Prunus dulcis TaxID=3755 RepID=A0A4Y1RC27_PRUDU|nr:organic cation/carnitine transporter 3 [Prunus dulcis]